MVTPVIPFIVACFAGSPPQVDLHAPCANIFVVAKQRNVLLIAQKYGGDHPHGPNPRGDDPNDEQHDPGLPANKEQKARRAPRDVYGNEYPNSKEPYVPW